MTNHWVDLKNSDVILIIGSNAAENHPISFKWINEARKKGAKLINVDPRFTRSSATADLYARLRSSTDIAFINGMIRWVIEDIEDNPAKYNMTYITEYTNLSFLIDPSFTLPADNGGKFSGFQVVDDLPIGQFGTYDKSTWKWQTDADGIPKKDKTLQDPNCVFQLLKKHVDRYTVEAVCAVTGTDPDVYRQVCELYAGSGVPDKSGTIMYAMGTTQHTHGTQNIRAYAILQLLLGNIGVAGGGINALRGESNVQGSTDHCLLWHILPGYLKPPNAAQTTLQAHLDASTPKASPDPKTANWWGNYPKYFVSLLKSWWGDNATEANEFGYHYLPKLEPGRNYSHIALFEAMNEGEIEGLICWGTNPAVGGPNANFERQAMDKLKWMVAVDLWETETCSIWQPEVCDDPANQQTEFFLLPAACSYEKEGSVVNSGRWAQWRWKGAEPPGEAHHDLWIVNQITMKLRELYDAEGGANPEPLLKLRWDYGDDPDAHQVAQEINGYALADIYDSDGNVLYKKGELLSTFGHLRADGTTSSANWLYTASYTEAGNMMARRNDTDYHPGGIGLYSNWSWCWPVNRRIIYNRASVDLDGKPFAPGKYVIEWNGSKWVGDVPDGGWKPMNMEGTRYPFIMKPEGFAHIFGPGRADGPFPEHYEPLESPVENAFSGTQVNPTVKVWQPDQISDRDQYPVVCTTYRVTEHWQAGQMTRNLPWLVELMPEVFVELSRELGEELGIATGDPIKLSNVRGTARAVAIVTNRFKPFRLKDSNSERIVHQVGIPWHWGFKGLARGDSANLLTPHVGDPNTMIPEFKAFLVKVEKAEGGA
jgi:formate dehydrogenase major subunit